MSWRAYIEQRVYCSLSSLGARSIQFHLLTFLLVPGIDGFMQYLQVWAREMGRKTTQSRFVPPSLPQPCQDTVHEDRKTAPPSDFRLAQVYGRGVGGSLVL